MGSTVGKVCIKADCMFSGVSQPYSSFYRRGDSSDGYFNICKDCMRKADKKNYEKRVLLSLNEVRVKKAQNARKRRGSVKLRLEENLSRGIRRSLCGRKQGASWESLVGYTAGDLMAWLESCFYLHPVTFTPMSFENYGDWHIDHIVPVALFDYKDFTSEEFKWCWSLDNIQPLWGEANLVKNSKNPEEWDAISLSYLWTKYAFGNEFRGASFLWTT